MKEGNGLLVHVVNRTGIVFVAALQSQSFFIVNVLSPFWKLQFITDMPP